MYAIVYLDAIQFKVKDNGHFKNKAAYLAIGVNMDGLKEVRWWIAQTEGVKFWLQVGDGAQESGRNRAEFSLKWNAQFSMIAKSRRSNWARVIPFFGHPPEIRKVIYTTNAIESLKTVTAQSDEGTRLISQR